MTKRKEEPKVDPYTQLVQELIGITLYDMLADKQQVDRIVAIADDKDNPQTVRNVAVRLLNTYRMASRAALQFDVLDTDDGDTEAKAEAGDARSTDRQTA